MYMSVDSSMVDESIINNLNNLSSQANENGGKTSNQIHSEDDVSIINQLQSDPSLSQGQSETIENKTSVFLNNRPPSPKTPGPSSQTNGNSFQFSISRQNEDKKEKVREGERGDEKDEKNVLAPNSANNISFEDSLLARFNKRMQVVKQSNPK